MPNADPRGEKKKKKNLFHFNSKPESNKNKKIMHSLKATHECGKSVDSECYDALPHENENSQTAYRFQNLLIVNSVSSMMNNRRKQQI